MIKQARYKNVLLIDDNNIDRFINKRVMEVANFSQNVIEEKSVMGALSYLRQSNTDGLPEIIFLDIRMPGIDGFGFLKAFGELSESIKSYTRIIMLSSTMNEKEINKIEGDILVYKFITKPLSVAALKDI